MASGDSSEDDWNEYNNESEENDEFYEHGSDENSDNEYVDEENEDEFNDEEENEKNGNESSDNEEEAYNEYSDSDDEWYESTIIESPGKTTRYWQPKMKKEFMIKEGDTFETIDEGVKKYSLYAERAGFDVRLNTTRKFGDETIKERYVVCNRKGKIPNKSFDTLDEASKGRNRRNGNFKKTNCKAVIILTRGSIRSTVCKVKQFIELHNHPLYDKEDRKYSKKARKLNFFDKELIVRCSTSNIGATRAHKLQASLKGGYDKVGPEVVDYKNFKRKMGNIIGDRDAQMLVDKMTLREIELPNYSFQYKCVDSVLNAMFWADETDKVYYKEFGDVISFDATFRTNKYGMIFVPFTAIDNHKRSINVGAGLLSSESIESYRWLLDAFLKAHVKKPMLVLTDQDPAVIQAVEAVMPESNHRLCMWHIMKKLQYKVGEDMWNNSNFRKRFSKLVWNVYIEPEEFEKRWHLLIDEYKLNDIRWFKDMYALRKSWIPAYFKELPRHGLMKTTSRSESANSFFNKFAHHGNYLIYFMMSYDFAIEKQRNTQRKKEHDTKIAKYDMRNWSSLEQHASEVYTKTIFLDVKNEINKGTQNCCIEGMETNDNIQIVWISHLDKSNQIKTKCKVELKMPEKVVKCSCHLFTRMGILCRHIFAVLKNKRIDKIPEEYILRRWRKDVISNHLLVSKHGCDETDDETFKLIAEAYSNLEHCLDIVKGDKQKLAAYVETTRVARKALDESYSEEDGCENEEEEILNMLGVKVPEKVEVLAPSPIRNKGRGTKKRMVSAREKAIKASKTKASKSSTRICTGCGLYVNHNVRTCPVKRGREEAAKNK